MYAYNGKLFSASYPRSTEDVMTIEGEKQFYRIKYNFISNCYKGFYGMPSRYGKFNIGNVTVEVAEDGIYINGLKYSYPGYITTTPYIVVPTISAKAGSGIYVATVNFGLSTRDFQCFNGLLVRETNGYPVNTPFEELIEPTRNFVLSDNEVAIYCYDFNSSTGVIDWCVLRKGPRITSQSLLSTSDHVVITNATFEDLQAEMVYYPYTALNSIIYVANNGNIYGPSSASSGDTVTLTVTPDTGYIFSSLAVYKTASQDAVSYTKVNDTTFTFVMPDTEVIVNAIFVRAYTISYGANPTTAGLVEGTESPARPGSEIRFKVTPYSGFVISSVSVNAGQTELDWNAETGIGRFIMPERNTYVTATLVTKDDPNSEGGTSQPEIPEGNFDNDSDNVILPDKPSTGIAYDISAGQGTGKGIVTIYNPSLEELKDLGQYLYANSVTDAIWNGLRNIFSNPMDAIISLHVLPFTPTRGTNRHTIALGPLNSQINSYIVSQQYQDVNLGTLRFQPYWDSYLDYSPYTKISLFLPYIGSVELNPDIVMGKLVGIKYRCDVLTGGCVAYLFTYEGEAGSTVESVFAEYSGSMALSLPLSGSDFAQIISGFISAVSSVAIMKGAGTGALVTNANESVEQARQQLASAHAARGEAYAMPKTVKGAGGRFVSNAAVRQEANSAYDSATQALQMARGQQRGVTALAGATHMATVPYTVGRVMGSKINTTISGTITGGLGLLGSQKPYVIITRPRQSLAEDYKHFTGYPSNITAQLNTLSGYTKVEQVELKNVPCTDVELAMLYDALKEGSYL